MGIHNEAGHSRLAPIPPLKELIKQLLDLIISPNDPERGFLPFQAPPSGDEVILLVNNLGGLSELELGGIVNETLSQLNDMNIVVKRIICGTFMVRHDVSNRAKKS